MFKTASALPAAAPKKAKAAKRQVTLPGVENLARVHALAALLEAVQGTLEGEVKRAAAALFEKDIAATGRRPESFDAIEGAASANVQFKKRAGNIALSPEAIALLAQNGLTPHREVIVPQLYGINPTHAANAELLAKVEAALAGIVPADFIVLQPEQVKHTVSDALFDEACAKKLPLAVLSAVSSLACKPKLNAEANVEGLLDFVRGLLTSPAPSAAANDAKAAA